MTENRSTLRAHARQLNFRVFVLFFSISCLKTTFFIQSSPYLKPEVDCWFGKTSGFVRAHVINSSKITQNDFWSPKYPTFYGNIVSESNWSYWNLLLTDPCSHGNEFWQKHSCSSAYKRDTESGFLYQTGIFEVMQFNTVIEIYLRRTLVAMATKVWKF